MRAVLVKYLIVVGAEPGDDIANILAKLLVELDRARSTESNKNAKTNPAALMEAAG